MDLPGHELFFCGTEDQALLCEVLLTEPFTQPALKPIGTEGHVPKMVTNTAIHAHTHTFT